MGKSEGEVKLVFCPRCGGTDYQNDSTLKGYPNVICMNCCSKRQVYPIHPNRLRAEGLVPAAALDEVVKALELVAEESRHLFDDHHSILPPFHRQKLGVALAALANAREITKGVIK